MIRTENLNFRINDFSLSDVSISLAHGEYFVLLGPPGAGKSVFLELLCGLKRPSCGRIYIDERDVTRCEPRRRSIGYVPQDYALFPHLTVERNIQFGLRCHSGQRRDSVRRVNQTADMLGIAHLLKRRVAGLSGGEKQRVALARALVLQPKVLLLDEPVSNLDESTRDTVCEDLRRLQQRLGVTTIHVSHDLEEAFSVADRAGILYRGRFLQIGTMDQLLRRPHSELVARFMRCENILSGLVVEPAHNEDYTVVKAGENVFTLAGKHTGEVKFMIRPENISLAGREAASDVSATVLPVTITQIADRGAYMRLALAAPGLRLVANLSHAAFYRLPPAALSALTYRPITNSSGQLQAPPPPKRSDENQLFAAIPRAAIHVMANQS